MGTERKLFYFLPRDKKRVKESACMGHLVLAAFYMLYGIITATTLMRKLRLSDLFETHRGIRESGFKVMSTWYPSPYSLQNYSRCFSRQTMFLKNGPHMKGGLLLEHTCLGRQTPSLCLLPPRAFSTYQGPFSRSLQSRKTNGHTRTWFQRNAVKAKPEECISDYNEQRTGDT